MFGMFITNAAFALLLGRNYMYVCSDTKGEGKRWR